MIIKTTEIPNIDFVGYYWMSDATEPKVIEVAATFPDELKECLGDSGKNPFVVEAQLYSSEKEISIGIKYVDGEYVVSLVNKNEIAQEKVEVTSKNYVANRMPGKRLQFLQFWKECIDPLCGDMMVLRPAEMAFVGFESTTLKEKEK